MKTKSGRVLTKTEIDRLAARADQGFDLSRWRPRGRPSLSARGEESPRISARVSRDVYARAKARAAIEGKSVSEVIRELLDTYAARDVAASSRRR